MAPGGRIERIVNPPDKVSLYCVQYGDCGSGPVPELGKLTSGAGSKRLVNDQDAVTVAIESKRPLAQHFQCYW
jgi:hypothetical protein